jgi:hypothetical protein
MEDWTISPAYLAFILNAVMKEIGKDRVRKES